MGRKRQAFLSHPKAGTHLIRNWTRGFISKEAALQEVERLAIGRFSAGLIYLAASKPGQGRSSQNSQSEDRCLCKEPSALKWACPHKEGFI
jgi:hypothetical protein